MKLNKGRVFILILVVILVIFSGVISLEKYHVKKNNELLKNNQENINSEANSIYDDIEGSEEKYKKLLENETDHFKRGMYSSAMVQINIAKSDYEQMLKYGEMAIESYNKIDGGVYHSIKELEYLAWTLLDMGRYSESFVTTTKLLDMLNSSGEEILTAEELVEIEKLVYSIFLVIYSEVGILDSAEFYYNKLNEMEETNDYRVAASKIVYANTINDIELIEKETIRGYEIMSELDKENGTNLTDSAILYLGIMNTKLGNFEEALLQIQKAEEFYSNMNYEKGLAEVYIAYGDYYDGVNKENLALDYYKKAMDIYYKSKDYNSLEKITEKTIDFLKESNVIENLSEYYEFYYDIASKSVESKMINDLLSEVVNINNELSSSRVLLLEREVARRRRNSLLAYLTIIILVSLIIKGYFLVKQKNKTEKELERIANTDYLTGLNNRIYGEKLVSEIISKNKELSIAVIDIDNFKSINDTYGHTFGDTVLVEVGNKINSNLDRNDIIYRFGGEEFIVAFIDKNKNQAKESLDKIRMLVSDINYDKSLKVTFSAGICEVKMNNLEESIKCADELLYRAKKEGRNRVIIS